MDQVSIGQVWQVDDKRAVRFVRITYVWNEDVTMRTCDDSGEFKPGTRFTNALKSRFGKSGGYKLVRATP